jgi:hypothetical protein
MRRLFKLLDAQTIACCQLNLVNLLLANDFYRLMNITVVSILYVVINIS